MTFAKLRRPVREFALTGQVAAAEEAEANIRVVQAAITRAQAEIRNPDRRRMLDEIGAKFDEYVALFGRARQMRAERDMLEYKTMDGVGAHAYEQLEALAASAAQADNNDTAPLARSGLIDFLGLRLVANKPLSRIDAGGGHTRPTANLQRSLSARRPTWFGAGADCQRPDAE